MTPDVVRFILVSEEARLRLNRQEVIDDVHCLKSAYSQSPTTTQSSRSVSLCI
jgi:hypothetical protein